MAKPQWNLFAVSALVVGFLVSVTPSKKAEGKKLVRVQMTDASFYVNNNGLSYGMFDALNNTEFY